VAPEHVQLSGNQELVISKNFHNADERKLPFDTNNLAQVKFSHTLVNSCGSVSNRISSLKDQQVSFGSSMKVNVAKALVVDDHHHFCQG